MKRKECYFGGSEVVENESGINSLSISCYNDGELSISDAEILDNENSPEVALFQYTDDIGADRDILIHKKDLLPLALFALNIYNEYSKRHDEMDFKDFSEKYTKH